MNIIIAFYATVFIVIAAAFPTLPPLSVAKVVVKMKLAEAAAKVTRMPRLLETAEVKAVEKESKGPSVAKKAKAAADSVKNWFTDARDIITLFTSDLSRTTPSETKPRSAFHKKRKSVAKFFKKAWFRPAQLVHNAGNAIEHRILSSGIDNLLETDLKWLPFKARMKKWILSMSTKIFDVLCMAKIHSNHRIRKLAERAEAFLVSVEGAFAKSGIDTICFAKNAPIKRS